MTLTIRDGLTRRFPCPGHRLDANSRCVTCRAIVLEGEVGRAPLAGRLPSGVPIGHMVSNHTVEPCPLKHSLTERFSDSHGRWYCHQCRREQERERSAERRAAR